MPLTSHNVGSMIAGQQAAFGNFASYAQQISPMGAQGPMPTYSNPMAGVNMAPTDPFGMGFEEMGPRAISAVGNIGLPAFGTAAMIGGSFLPGMAGRAFGAMDPFSAGLGGFMRGAGLRAGGAGVMSNLGRIASGGVGSIARAGFAGLGGAMMGAAAPLAIGSALQWGVGQMVEGAQFQNQVGNFLQQNFRQLNPMSETGFGFGREQRGQISDMLREMGSKDIMSSPQELRRIMEQGTGMGMFRAVQDVKEFKKKFTDMVGALKEVATTMNTTLEGAMPFLQQARQQGFWTPQDITRNAQMARQAAGATGMSVASAQQMMGQGAAMARQVGALGAYGAEGMYRTMQAVGGALRGGTLSSEQLSEMTGGLSGEEAIQAFSGRMQAATTRFASGRVGRWMLAALGGKGFQSLDTSKLAAMARGDMTVGAIGSGARRNIGREGAFNFVMNEEQLRGELLKQGPEVQAGMVRGLIGRHLYGEDPRSQYITRRVIKRFFGGSTQEADAMAKMARDLPQIMRENQQRAGSVADQEARNRDRMMDETWEGVKRKASEYMRRVSEPIQKFGAEVSREVTHTMETISDRLFGTSATRYRFRGVERGAMQALQRRALGDTGAYTQQFASGTETRLLSSLMGRGEGAMLGGGPAGGFMSLFDPTRAAQRTAYEAYGRMPEGARETARQLLSVAQGGELSSRAAEALKFQDKGQAATAIRAARAEMQSAEFKRQSFHLAQRSKEEGIGLGQKMVEEIRSGRMGGRALRALVGKEGDDVPAVMRLASAQTDEMRQESGGINLSQMSRALGVSEGLSGRELEAQISHQLEGTETVIAEAASTGKGWFRSGVGQKDVAALVEKGGDELRQAMTMFGSGLTSEDRAKNTQRARNMIANLGRDSSRFSKEEQSLLAAMSDPQHPGSALMKAAMDKQGALLRLRNNKAVGEVVARRAERMRKSMGTMREKIESTLDRLGGPGERSVGQIVRELTSITAGSAMARDPAQYADRLGQLAEAAADMSPEKAAQAAELLRGIEGGDTFASAIESTIGLSKGAKELTTKGGGKKGFATRLKAAQYFAQQMGVGKITDKELLALEKGGKSAEDIETKILERSPEAARESNKRMLEAIASGDERRIRTVGKETQASRVVGLLGDPSAEIFQKKLTSMRLEGTMGDPTGSPKGMHQTLMRIAETLDRMEKTKGLAPEEDASGKPGKTP